MTTGVTCTVLVDGVRAADGSPGDDLSGPVLLENLAVTWGRSDTMSQPDADSCTFELLDSVGGGEGFASLFRTGSRIDVLARGDLSSEAQTQVQTFTNSDFESAAVTWSTTGGTAARVTSRFLSPSHALSVRPSSSAQAAVLLLAPAPFESAGTNPDAWDDIATTELGQSWTVKLALWMPPGAVAEIRPVLFSGPYANAGTIASVAPTIANGNGAWQTWRTEYVVTDSLSRWVGIEVRLFPAGPAWNDVPPTLLWDFVDPTITWDDFGTMYVDDAQVIAPGQSHGSVLVFAGRVTELTSQWDDAAAAPLVSVVANGFTADMQNRSVGDEPWNVESVAVRSQRILNAVGLPVSIDIDASLAPILLSWRDVDSQGAIGLLQSIATSVDGVLWPAVHAALGAYLRLEDPALRLSLLLLIEDETGTIVIVEGNPEESLRLSACDILRDPISWTQSVSDVATRVSVTWKAQGVDDQGLPTTTEVTEHLIDAALEAEHGTRAVSVSTELQSATDANAVAQRVLKRTSSDAWRASGLTLDDDDIAGNDQGRSLLLDLLDGTSRIGAPIVITDLPSWAPAGSESGVYLEGGTYTYVGGRWVLELVVSSSDGFGGSAAWDDLDPDWTWDQFDPTITWNDLHGVSAN
jgi:hypothetical protein